MCLVCSVAHCLPTVGDCMAEVLLCNRCVASPSVCAEGPAHVIGATEIPPVVAHAQRLIRSHAVARRHQQCTHAQLSPQQARAHSHIYTHAHTFMHTHTTHTLYTHAHCTDGQVSELLLGPRRVPDPRRSVQGHRPHTRHAATHGHIATGDTQTTDAHTPTRTYTHTHTHTHTRRH